MDQVACPKFHPVFLDQDISHHIKKQWMDGIFTYRITYRIAVKMVVSNQKNIHWYVFMDYRTELNSMMSG